VVAVDGLITAALLALHIYTQYITEYAPSVEPLMSVPHALLALLSEGPKYGLRLSVERGELVAIMGPSGSGKSTLLTIAGSLEQPSSGQVLVDGVELSSVSRSEQAKMRRRSIGYVFQDFNLLPGLTAAENVTLPLELDGAGAGVKAARASGLTAVAPPGPESLLAAGERR
jgi:ABC-type thiamine transport system ATPase subunit